jgi:hypothetical protein
MYLIFENKNEADTRNMVEAAKRGHDMIRTRKVWHVIKEYEDGRIALDVLDGEGLTSSELSQCVDELPINPT